MLFLLVQVFVLNKMPYLHRFIVPSLYFLFLLWLPFNLPRLGLLLAAFITGLSLDYFTMSPGLHAASCVLIAYVRPFVIFLLIPKESSEFTYHEPSPRGMGWGPYLFYAFILTFLHHICLTFLQWMQVGSFLDFLIKTASSTAISLLLIIITELLFPRKLKYRTNTA
jgi:hypothetical protein